MKTFRQLIEEGYEIKAAVLLNADMQHVYLQKGGDVWICPFRRHPDGHFRPTNCYQIA